MGTKQRSILLIISVFILGGLSGFFGRGIYDQARWKIHRESRSQYPEKSRFVGFFLSVIKPEPHQKSEILTVLERWDSSMKDLQLRYVNESQTGFRAMVEELSPHLKPQQLQSLKAALERFGRHRRHGSQDREKTKTRFP